MKKLKNLTLAESLFAGWEETMIWSCLQGVMGDIWVDDEDNPQSAIAKLGKQSSFGFLAGQPHRGLIDVFREEDMILVPQNDAWSQLLEETGDYRAFTRYATRKDTIFDKEKLENFSRTLPEDVTLFPIDRTYYHACLQQEWSRDLVGNYDDDTHYQKLGLGFVAVKDGTVIAGASSYATYDGGIEIEIDTREDYRRQGLAKALASKLILTCLERGMYPSWDAHNKESLHLVQQLGYVFSHDYVAYEIDKTKLFEGLAKE